MEYTCVIRYEKSRTRYLRFKSLWECAVYLQLLRVEPLEVAIAIASDSNLISSGRKGVNGSGSARRERSRLKKS